MSNRTGSSTTLPARGFTTANVAEVGWLAVLLLVPLALNPFGAYVFEPVKVSIFRSLATLTLLVTLLSRLRHGGWKLRSSDLACFLRYPLAVPVLFSAVSCTLATVFAVDPVLSFWGSCTKMYGAYTQLSYVFVWVATVCHLRSDLQIQRVFRVICLASALAGVFAAIQWMHLDPIPWQDNFGGRVFSTLSHPNTLGAYMAMSIPITISAALARPSRRLRRAMFLAPVLLIQALALAESESRAGAAGTVAGLLFFAAVGVARFFRRTRARRIAVAAILCLTIAASPWFIPRVSALGASFVQSRSNTVTSRLLIWQVSLKLASQRPVMGFGPDTFGIAFQSSYPPVLAHFEGYDVTPDRAHNLLLDTMVMTGALGLASLLTLWATFYAKTIVSVWKSKFFPWYMVAVASAFTAYVTQGLFSFDVVALGSLLWILLAVASVLLAGPKHNADEQRGLHAWPRIRGQGQQLGWASSVLIGAVLCIVMLANFRFDLANTWRHRGQMASSRGNLQTAITFYSKAIDLCPECEEDLARLASTLVNRFRSTGDVVFLEAAENALLLAQQRSPYEAQNHVNLGHLYLVWGTIDPGKLEQATEAYQQVLRLVPCYPQYYDYLGLAHQMSGDIDAATAAFDQALILDPIHVPTYARQGTLYLELGQHKLAESHLQSAVDAYLEWVETDPGIVSAGTFSDELAIVYTTLSQLEYARGEILEALYYCQALVKLDPTSWVGHRNLAMIYRDLGQVERARAEALAALELSPGDESLKELLQRLEGIDP